MDLLDENDWFGITIDGDPAQIGFASNWGLSMLLEAKGKGIKTWVSFEPVLDAGYVLTCIRCGKQFFDKVKIGKLNYWPSDIDWAQFGRDVGALCREMDLDYYIKDSLRTEMDKHSEAKRDG